MNRFSAIAWSVLCLSGVTVAAEVRDEPSETPASVASEAEESEPSVSLPLSLENDSVEGLAIELMADGVSRVNLQGRFQHALIAVIAPDGSSRIECVDSAERAAELLGIDPASLIDREDSSHEK